MSEIEIVEERLRRFAACRDDRDWFDVLRRAGVAPSGRAAAPRRWRPILVTAVCVAALAGAGIAIAAGFGAFDNLSAAQQPQTSSDMLNPQTATNFQQLGCGAGHTGPNDAFVPYSCDPSSSRLVSALENGDKLYVLADSGGHLCLYLQGAGLTQCGPPLSRAYPTWYTGRNDSGDLLVAGVAMDGVTSVSFTLDGNDVTVPVKNNAWAYENPSAPKPASSSDFTFPECLSANFADGSTVVAQPDGCSK
jgi:hypothetical protein